MYRAEEYELECRSDPYYRVGVDLYQRAKTPGTESASSEDDRWFLVAEFYFVLQRINGDIPLLFLFSSSVARVLALRVFHSTAS